jgi:hypothetical protein
MKIATVTQSTRWHIINSQTYETWHLSIQIVIFLPKHTLTFSVTLDWVIPGFMMGSVLLLFLVFCVVSLRSEFHVYCNCRKKNDVRFVISSICLWESSCFIGVICVDLCSWWCPGHFVLWFCLFFFVLCTLCCQFLWIVQLWLLFRYSLTFICITEFY